jgi:hypothetical protein
VTDNQFKLTYIALYGLFLLVALYLMFRPKKGTRENPIVINPVMIVNPDGSPVRFGREPLIVTDSNDREK